MIYNESTEKRFKKKGRGRRMAMGKKQCSGSVTFWFEANERDERGERKNDKGLEEKKEIKDVNPRILTLF